MKNDKYARMQEKSTEKVVTVPRSENGLAACADDPEIFEKLVTFSRTSNKDRRKAATTCSGCAIRDTCGFRVVPAPTHRQRTPART
ncbi:hypothetical protein [Streptomyces sp. TR02-1]|uniref:hypothetical protein n=1 Tax=Streptomyces sp. TR02-1 TaxID=3385977 RepID=UPI0039A19AA8